MKSLTLMEGLSTFVGQKTNRALAFKWNSSTTKGFKALSTLVSNTYGKATKVKYNDKFWNGYHIKFRQRELTLLVNINNVVILPREHKGVTVA